MKRFVCLLLLLLAPFSGLADVFCLPAKLTVIGEEAFCGTEIADIAVPDGVTEIGSRAFADSALCHITLPGSVAYIAEDAFAGLAAGFYMTVQPDSYAQRWCVQHSIACTYGLGKPAVPEVSGVLLSEQGSKYIGTSYSVYDCQAFVERCLADAGLQIDLAGSNAWYREMDWTGTPEECVALFGRVPKGAFLFILEQDGGELPKYKPDGLGNASHIGIATGTGLGAIHSSYTRYSVQESYFAGESINGGWNRVGLWHRVDYGTAVNLFLTGKQAAGSESE